MLVYLVSVTEFGKKTPTSSFTDKVVITVCKEWEINSIPGKGLLYN